MALISQREYARRKGWSSPYVNRLVKQGKIPNVGGKIDPVRADAALANNRPEPPRVDASAPHSVPREPTPVSYLQARTVSETYKAKKQKLEYEQLTGKLVETDRVMESAEKAFSNVRVRLRGLAKGLAPILASNHHAAEVEKALADAIDGALEGLSTDIFK